MERLKIEILELHKSKCQSLELIEQRDAEIKEKDGIIQSYYDKIVSTSVYVLLIIIYICTNQSIWQPYS